jgi:hypothetical protein
VFVSKFKVVVTIHLDESQDCDVVSVLWMCDIWQESKNKKRIVYGRRVLKEGMTEALKEGV